MKRNEIPIKEAKKLMVEKRLSATGASMRSVAEGRAFWIPESSGYVIFCPEEKYGFAVDPYKFQR